MKNSIFIFGAITLLLTSCATNRCGTMQPTVFVNYVYAIDSSGVSEDLNDRGVFFKTFDTINIRITTKYNRQAVAKITYKIVE